MIIDWKCPYCYENHLSEIRIDSLENNLNLFCTNCNKNSAFSIKSSKTILQCEFVSETPTPEYFMFTLIKK